MTVRAFGISISVVFLVVAVAAPLAAQCATPPSGLISWWPGAGDATDLTGGNDGTISGATTFVSGMVGQAFKFGGAVGEAVDVGVAPNLQLQNLTIEAWISRASTLKASLAPSGSAGSIFGYGQKNGYVFELFDEGRLSLARNGDVSVESTSLSVTDLLFHHVAVTKDGAIVTFCVDSVPETVLWQPAPPPFVFTSNATVGAEAFPSRTANFLGVIDEVSVYNRELESDEIQAIVAAGSYGKCR